MAQRIAVLRHASDVQGCFVLRDEAGAAGSFRAHQRQIQSWRMGGGPNTWGFHHGFHQHSNGEDMSIYIYIIIIMIMIIIIIIYIYILLLFIL
jgi:hypothetical protein